MTSTRMLLIASTLLLAPACGTTSDNGTDGAVSPVDASTAAPDLAAVADLATPPSPDLTQGCSTALLLGPQWTTPDDTCKSCAITNCCAVLAACARDPACVTLRTCFAACAGASDFACQTACTTKLGANGPSGGVGTCRTSTCGSACADFACVGKVTWPAPAKQTYTMTVRFVDYLSGAVVMGVTAKICDNADTACAQPLGTVMADGKGTILLTVPSAPGTAGAYLEVTAGGYPTFLVYLTAAPAVVLDGADRALLLISTNTLGILSGAAQQQQDAGKGLLVFQAHQCGGYGAPGLTVRGDSGTTVYVAASLPAPAATTTDGSGRGAIFNMAPGLATITTMLGGKPYGTQKMISRAGAVTLSNLVPTP